MAVFLTKSKFSRSIVFKVTGLWENCHTLGLLGCLFDNCQHPVLLAWVLENCQHPWLPDQTCNEALPFTQSRLWIGLSSWVWMCDSVIFQRKVSLSLPEKKREKKWNRNNFACDLKHNLKHFIIKLVWETIVLLVCSIMYYDIKMVFK